MPRDRYPHTLVERPAPSDPLFQPNRPYVMSTARRATVLLPDAMEVVEELRRGFDRIVAFEGRRPYAVVLGGRWFASLSAAHLDWLGQELRVDIWIDPVMERGCRSIEPLTNKGAPLRRYGRRLKRLLRRRD